MHIVSDASLNELLVARRSLAMRVDNAFAYCAILTTAHISLPALGFFPSHAAYPTNNLVTT